MITKIQFTALAERPFRLLWLGRTVSAFGDAIMPVTLVFAILSVGGSATDIGMVLAVTTVVRVVLLVFGGALADRLPRQLILICSDLALAAVQVIVGILLLTGRSDVTVLLIAAVCYGAAAALSKPAMTGLVPQTVSAARLQQANALMGMSQSAARIVGPAFAGVLAAVAEPGIAYLVDASTFIVSVSTLMFLKLPKHIHAAQSTLFRDILEGWQEMVARPWYWAGLCCHAVWNVGLSVFLVLGPVVVAQATGTPSSWALVATATAVGALLGGVLAASWRPQRPLVAGHLALLLAVLQLCALIGPSPLPVIMAASALTAAGMTLLNEVWITSIQQLVPENVISRISSYDWLVSFIVAPLGYAAAGPVSEHVGIPTTLACTALLVAGATGAVLMVPGIREVRQATDGGLVKV